MSKIKEVCDKIMNLHLLGCATRIVHYTTQSYHTHELADRLNMSIMDFTDRFAESYFGIYGKPSLSDISMNQADINKYKDIQGIVDKAREICADLRKLIENDKSGLVSRIDDLDNNLANIAYLAVLKESKGNRLTLNKADVRKMVNEAIRLIINESGFDDMYYDDFGQFNYNGSGYEPEVNPYNNVVADAPRSNTYNSKDNIKQTKVVADCPGFRIEWCEGEYGDFYRIRGGGSRILFNNHEKYCPANHGIYRIPVANAKVIYHFDTDKGKIVKTERLRG